MTVQPITAHNDRTDKAFAPSFSVTTSDNLYYSYNHSKGFLIKKSGSTEKISMRYFLSDQDIEKIANKDDFPLMGVGEPAVIIPTSPVDYTKNSYCRFQNGSNIYSVQQPDSSGSVNRKEYEIDENPLIVPYLEEETQRTMLPLRCFANIFDFQVGWNEQTEEILLTKEPYQITMKLDSKLVKAELRNGPEILWMKEFEMETPAVTRFERTFVPVRFLGELFGYYVSYYCSPIQADTVNDSMAVGITPRSNDYFLDIFPYMETDQGEQAFGLDIMNSHKLPFLFHFSDDIQMSIRIYDLSGSLISEEEKAVTPTDNDLLLPPEQNIRTGYSIQSKLVPGSYYADIKLKLPDFPDTYRMFFEAV